MAHPLHGVRVLDLTRLLPGAVATMMLADLGADVVKVEDPNGGDYARWMGPQIAGQSVFFRMNNRDKRSIILNLKDKAGQDVLKRLVQQADVLIEGFRPGVMTRLGCDYDALKTVNPRLVFCALSGWGAEGPYAQSANHDLNYVSVAGMPNAMETPQVMGGQVADIGGAFIAVSGILAALFRRERTGTGGFVDASLAESALPFMLYNWVEALTFGFSGGRGILTGGQACYRVYTAQDGRAVALGAIEEKFWGNFCNAVGHPEWIEHHINPARQQDMIREVSALFASRTASEWQTVLDGVDCCFTVVNAPAEIADDPHFQAREMLGIFDDGTPWMRSPIRLNDSHPDISDSVPGYGAHTHEVLRAAGYDDAEIAALEGQSVIRQG